MILMRLQAKMRIADQEQLRQFYVVGYTTIGVQKNCSKHRKPLGKPLVSEKQGISNPLL